MSEWIPRAHGSFGSRGGEPWSEKIAQANRRTAPTGSMAGVHEAAIAPSKEALQAAIKSQICPWCGRGPFRALAIHTNAAHGVGRLELRDLAGVPRSSSVCSQERSEASRSSLLSRTDRTEMSAKGAKIGQGIGSKMAREVNAKRYIENNKERDAAIVAAVQSGRLRIDVAEDFGIECNTVLSVLKRYGFNSDGRTARGLARRGVEPPAARAGIERKQAVTLIERKARWSDLGGDHYALVRMAQELGVSHKHLRDYFKKAGVPVPDGRL